ncbi:hypothetical protein C8J56DRAFT_302268 [Mycena floridula]|nr:hypothetical protein C8J56DRAFT_302268 [Mycena floridula]
MHCRWVTRCLLPVGAFPSRRQTSTKARGSSVQRASPESAGRQYSIPRATRQTTRHPTSAESLSRRAATSHKSLYRNLLYLLSTRRPPAITALLDYHDLYPYFRSTRSYNLLISHALRHASFGTVRWLLKSMNNDMIPQNKETEKLKARWSIQQGWWDNVWSIVDRSSFANRKFAAGGHIPEHLWLEFFRAPARGAEWRGKPFEGQIPLPPLSDDHRLTTLLGKRPMFTEIPPRIVYFTLRGFLYAGRKDSAMKLAVAYLGQLPQFLDMKLTKGSLDIIHLLMAHYPESIGLRRLHETRRMLMKLQSLHPSFRPTSVTLYLLLGSLSRASQCGTQASNVVASFKMRWGPQVEDNRVRRRVASLALKEGRLDIVQKMFSDRSIALGKEKPWLPSVRRILPHRPFQEIYPKIGLEKEYWIRLRKRWRQRRRNMKRGAMSASTK